MADEMIVKELDQVVVRFSGDSGDGMQLAGNIFSNISATVGNDISTFPDYPADIRAPQGSLTGVSGFQVHIGAGKVFTPGDKCDVLVAMNAAALKTQYKFAKSTACIIIDTDCFQKSDLDKAAFKTDNPIEEMGIKQDVIAAPISQMVKDGLADTGMDNKSMLKCRNMFALGLVCWLFIKTYEQLREYIISQKAITSLIQMEYSAFEEATVPICSFVLKNGKSTEKALCFRLSDFKGGMQVQKEKVLEALEQTECSYFYEAQQDDFAKIPGSPIAYWASESLIDDFKNGTSIGNVLDVRQGLATADNDRFIRLWFEVASDKCKFDSACEDDLVASEKKWVPYNKGGQRRQWYGNYDYLVNWENRGFEIKNFKDKNGKLRSRPQNTDTYFKEAITWGLITSGGFSIRYRNSGGIHDVSGMSAFTNDKKQLKYILGILSTPIANYIFKMLNPTINLQVGDFKNFPLLYNECASEKVVEITNDCINIAKKDWDSFETSWNFLRYPMVLSSRDRKEQEQSQFATSRMGKYGSLLWQYEKYKTECEDRFQTLKSNEEELNRIFIDIYGLQDELTPEVEDKDVTVYRIFDSKEEIPESMGSSKYSLTRQDVVKDLISYAVGCMFGRYSLDVDGLAYAGGEWDNSKYDTFIPDEDNCIPITDEEYFEDDIVGLFCAWLKKVYGEDTLEENLDFIANALGNKGKTSREVIRNYFLTDFIKDHIKTYQKRPIYWLFDSGKQNGFKALVYMHRWNGDTIGNVRVEYLHRIQRVYEKEITRMQEIIDNSHDNKEISNATKRKEKLQKQIKETKDYDAKIAHLALSRIDIDLDDGVKINYEKVQTADGKKMQILAKI